MADTIPRWGLPNVRFVETDATTVRSDIITRYESISGRVLADGDPVRLFLLSIADIVIQLRKAINTAGQQNLLSYAKGEYMDALGQYLSVYRLKESSAVTTLEFRMSQALANTYTIPKGTAVTNGIVTFTTDNELQIQSGSTYGVVSATCTESGAKGNGYLAGQVATIVNPMPFVDSASNVDITAGGADAEGDEELAERIRLAPNAFSVAGPEKAYMFHAFSVSSAIIDVSVMSPTPGYVNVYPLIEGGTLPTFEILKSVEDKLMDEEIRPLTDFVNVLAPEAENYQIVIDYWISEDDSANSELIQKAVKNAVEEYRQWQQSKIGRDITPEKLLAKVMNAGASRVDSETQLPQVYKALGDDTVAQCTSVTVTYQGVNSD